MKYILTTEAQDGITALSERLINELDEGKRALWLVSGGSNIPLSVQVMENIPASLSRKLTVLPADERYGKPGHPDSNVSQLLQAGFKPHQAELLTVLEGLSLEATRERYEQMAKDAFQQADIILAQLGMGADGHIAGILPHSAALESGNFVSAYQGPDFSRLTLTSHAIKRIEVAYVFAFGAAKRNALEHLQQQMLPYAEQPAQMLKELPEVYVYNDQIGDVA